MEKIDIDKLKIAIEYINRMSNEKNPVDKKELQDESFLKNQNVKRCLEFIEYVLTKVYDNQGYIGRIPRMRRTASKDFPIGVLEQFEYKEDKTISALVKQVNDLISDDEVLKINYKWITGWLKEQGYLSIEFVEGVNKDSTIVTQKGLSKGMYCKIKTGNSGKRYVCVSYSEEAQYFIVKNIPQILEDVRAF